MLLDLLDQGQTEAQAMATIADQFYDAGIQYEVYDPNMDTDAFITLAYQNVLGRNLDNEPPENKAEALGWWGPQLEDGSLSKGQFILNLIDAAKAYADDPEWGWVPKYLEARQQAGLLFAQSELGNIADPDEAIAKGTAVLAPISPATFQQNPDADPAEVARQAFNDWKAEEIGQTFMLTQGAETVEGTDGDDTITGVSSALSSARTLDAGDKIDGGAGNDTLKVDLQSSFAGFSGEGFLKNVEVVELTNSGAIAREFSAKGVEGVQSYVLNGDVSLKDLASTAAAITLNGQQKNVTVGFADKVTDGTADALTLNLNGVGTADDAATTADETVRVQLTAAGIEELNLGVAGTNVVTVTAAAAKSVVATGEGSLDAGFSGSANVKTIDASAVAGNVTLDLDALTAATSVKTGAGDDTISADTDNLAVNATIDGGAGADRLVLETGTTTTTQYSMSGVETLALESSGSLTFSAKNVTGLETVEVASGYNANATLANLGSADLTFALKEDSSGSITADNAGAATVNVTPVKDAKDYAGPDNDTDLTLTNATSVALNVAKFAEYTGTVNALKATSLEAKIDGKINNTINLTAATAAVFNATDSKAASTVTLQADKLVDLNITTAGAFTVSGSSSLSKLEALTVATAGAFSIGNLAAINTINLTGTGTATLGNLGATDLDYGITVNASGLAGSGALTIGNIAVGAGQSINLNVAGVAGEVDMSDSTATVSGGTGSITVNANGTQGNVDLGDLQAKSVTVNAAGALGTVDVAVTAETATVTGSELKVNTIDVTASKSATVTGGIANDVFRLATDADGATVSFDGGLGTSDAVTLTGNSVLTNSSFSNVETLDVAEFSLTIDNATLANLVTSKTLVDLTDDSKPVLTVKGTDAADIIDASKVEVAKIAALTIEGGKGNDTIKLGDAVETVKFAATAADNGVDTISGFTAGADVLYVSELVGTTILTDAFGKAGTESALADGTVVSYTNAGTALDAAGVAALFATETASDKYYAGANSDYIFVEQAGNTAKLWVINNDNDAAVTAAEVKLVGTVNADAALVIENFA